MHLLAIILALVACQGRDKGSDTSANDDAVDGWFVEATLDPPLFHNRAVWAGVAMLDFDGDGWTDLYFTNGKGESDSLYRNQGDGSFVDVAEEVGIDVKMESGSVVAGDLDNDGDADLVVSASCSTGSYDETGGPAYDSAKVVYLNQGDGTFGRGEFSTDMPVDTVPVEVGAFCTISMHLADIDRDGFLDILLGNSVDPDVVAPWIFNKGDASTLDWGLLNDGAGNFVHPVKLPTSIGTTFAFATFDGDGDGVLETVAGRSGYTPEEIVWNGSQEAATTGRIGTQAGLWMGIAVADYDRDGDLDFYSTNQGLSTLMHGYDNTSVAVLPEGVEPYLYHAFFENEGGELSIQDWPVEAEQMLAGDLFEGLAGDYLELTQPEGLKRYPWGWGAVALDVDADGWVDVATTGNACAATMDIIWTEDRGAGPGSLLMNDGAGGFVDRTWEAGIENIDDQGRYQDGRGLAVGDLDRDGYPDLVFVNKSYNPTQSDPLAQELGTPHVWLSAGMRDNNWLVIQLVGTVSARDALGATVYVTDSRGRTAHAYGAGGGTNSTSESSLILGLGADDSVDIEVVFPSGDSVFYDDVAANQRIEIAEDGS